MDPAPGLRLAVGFWHEVKTQALAGCAVVVMTAVVGGIGYLIHTVPKQLAEVLENQNEFKIEQNSLQRMVENHGHRLVRLEVLQGVGR